MSGTETGRRCLAAYLMGGTALALSALFVSSPASAQEVPAASEVRRYAFDIDAKPLAEAIWTLCGESEHFVFNNHVAKGRVGESGGVLLRPRVRHVW